LLSPTYGFMYVWKPRSFIFQNPDHQVVMPTVGADVAFGLGRFNLSNDETKLRVATALTVVGVYDYLQYKDELMFDIVEMDACHIILGKPWVCDLKATYNDTENTYMFWFNGVKKILVPLIDNNDTMVSKPTQDDSKVTGQQDLKEEPKDKIVTEAIVATT
nr:ABC transporter I family member 10, chloroplastic [Tanacetum cinerariifolium]